MPYVIEPALGVNRSMLTFMIDAYDEEVVGERERTVLRLHPQLAPVKAAILPLIGKDTAMVEKARALYEELRRHYSVEYDDNGAIGRRYRRQDEIGTPYGLTIDEQTLEDDTVTVRDRDSLAQERIPIGGARAKVGELLAADWKTPKSELRASAAGSRRGARTTPSRAPAPPGRRGRSGPPRARRTCGVATSVAIPRRPVGRERDRAAAAVAADGAARSGRVADEPLLATPHSTQPSRCGM